MSLPLCRRFRFDTEGTALSAFDVGSHSLSCHRLHFDAAGGLGRVCGTFAPPCINMDLVALPLTTVPSLADKGRWGLKCCANVNKAIPPSTDFLHRRHQRE